MPQNGHSFKKFLRRNGPPQIFVNLSQSLPVSHFWLLSAALICNVYWYSDPGQFIDKLHVAFVPHSVSKKFEVAAFMVATNLGGLNGQKIVNH